MKIEAQGIKYVFKLSLCGFNNVHQGVSLMVDQLLNHQSSGKPISPDVYVVGPSEAVKLFSFNKNKSEDKKLTYGSGGGQKMLLDLNAGNYNERVIFS